MLWMIAYCVPAFLVGVMSLAHVDRTHGCGPTQAYRTLAALAAGLLWPVLAAGAAQFGVLVVIRKAWRAVRPATAAEEEPARPGPQPAVTARQTVGV